jgi:hypothetical protein
MDDEEPVDQDTAVLKFAFALLEFERSWHYDTKAQEDKAKMSEQARLAADLMIQGGKQAAIAMLGARIAAREKQAEGERKR